MNRMVNRILEELRRHKCKQGHWAWWVFPTEKEGFCEPSPKTAVTMATAPLLLMRCPREWREVLETLLSLSKESDRGIRGVLPGVDHDRVRYFAAFWKDKPDTEGVDASWIRELALEFETAFS
jgi:hypothetical protein